MYNESVAAVFNIVQQAVHVEIYIVPISATNQVK